MLLTNLVETTVRPLERHEVRRASLLLAAAFADDPFIGHFLRDRRRRDLALPRLFRAVLHELSAGRATYALEVDGIVTGVAAWAPPDDPALDRASRLRARIAELELRALFPRAASEVLGGFEELGRRHPPIPHWYLAFVGIDPRWQGHGLGRLVLEPVLARADARGAPRRS